jgi:D-alanine-D-alanine ligase
MHVVILHNAVSPGDSAADQDVLVQAAAVSSALAELGHTSSNVPCTLDLAAARDRLREAAPDVVFNLVESLGGSDWLASAAAGLLDTMDLPYTGSSTEALLLTNHKLLAKQRLCQAGLPTPHWAVLPTDRTGSVRDPRARVARSERARSCVDRESHALSGRATPAQATDAQFPAFVIKTLWEHASFELDEHSIVHPTDEAELLERLRASTERLRRPCFAEQYVDGREFNLSVLAGPDGPEVLPAAEIDFSAFPPGQPRIVGNRAKWDEGSFVFQNTPRRFEFPPGDRPLLERLAELAREAWRLFGLGGYARVDFRVDDAGEPWILEINANPCLSPDAGFVAALAQGSIPFPQAVARILQDALR